MSEEEFRELLELCLEESATPEQQERVVAAARETPALAEILSQSVNLDAALRSLKHDRESFVQRVRNAINAGEQRLALPVPSASTADPSGSAAALCGKAPPFRPAYPLPVEAAPPPSLMTGLVAAVGLGGPLGASDLALFAEMLAGLVRSKLPLPEALRLIGRETENRRLRGSLEAVEKEVAAGAPLPDALRRCGGKFPELFTRLLDQGVAANDLHAALVELVREYRSQARFREQLWSQLMAPVVTSMMLGLVVIGLILFNVPQVFATMYQGWWGLSLPFPTRVMLELGRMVRDPRAIAAFLCLCVAAVIFFRRLRATPLTRLWIEKLALHFPVIGPYLRTALVARFCRMLGILLARRIPLNTALVFVRDSMTFLPVQLAVGQVCEAVDKGGVLSDAIGACRIFPPTLASFVRGAELTGELPQSLSRLADLYEERADLQGTQVRLLLFVSMQLAIGACVVFLVIGCFAPMYLHRW